MKTSKNILNFGKASNLNITLENLKIKENKLHIIYYNFPEINSPPIKITKQCADKINKLYVEEKINPEDSIILIITDKISPNLERQLKDLYGLGQEYLNTNGISDEILEKKNNKLGEKNTK